MKKTAFGSAKVPLTPAIKVGNTIYVSGQVPRDQSGQVVSSDVREQTKQVLDNLTAVLETAGATLNDVVKTTVILVDVQGDFAAVNEVYASYFPDPKPTRTAIGAALQKGILVEIEAVAVVVDD